MSVCASRDQRSSGPGRAALRLIQRGADRRHRDIDLTLREPQLRKTRLRLPSRLEG